MFVSADLYEAGPISDACDPMQREDVLQLAKENRGEETERYADAREPRCELKVDGHPFHGVRIGL